MMNRFALRCWPWLTLVALIAIGCENDAPSGANAATATARTKVDFAFAALSPKRIALVPSPRPGDADKIVYLIGENHASVRGQLLLADLLSEMSDHHSFDAILIEGSNGTIPPPNLNGGLSSKDADAYWHGQLEWGKIAGYEYFAISHPGVLVHGVENMAAKAAFALEIERFQRAELDDLDVSQSEALRLCEDACERLRAAGDMDPPAEAVRTLRRAAASAHDAAQQLVNTSAVTPIRLAAEIERSEAVNAYVQLLPSVSGGDALVAEYRRRFAAFKALRAGHAAEISEVESFPSPARVAKLERNLQPVIDAQKSLEDAQKALEAFESRHRDSFAQLKALDKRIENAAKTADRLDAPLVARTKILSDALSAFRDAFFRTANAMGEHGSTRGLSFADVDTFYRRDAARKRASSKIRGPSLERRDEAMTSNTSEIFASRTLTSAVLIIGNQHLEGMSSRLRSAGFKVVAGTLVGADDELDHWEDVAWRRRQSAASRSFWGNDGMKELSRLLNGAWGEEQLRQIASLRRLGQDGSFRLLDSGLGRTYVGGAHDDHALYVTDRKFARGALFGEHLVDAGPVPENAGAHFEAFDRGVGADQAKKLSKGDIAFVYFHKMEANGSTGYQLHGPEGPKSLATFEKRPPLIGSNPARRVVFFGEPDEAPEGELKVSPLWKRLRTGGDGSEPPRPPNPPDSPADVPEDHGPPKGAWMSAFLPRERRASVYRTINAARARLHLDAIDLQVPSKMGELHFAEPNELDKLKFTPRTGENANVLVIVARNTEEFRTAIKAAAEAGKLENKQIALITCGDAFEQTVELRELLLDSRSLLVWTPDRQITPEAARKLADWVRKTWDDTPPSARPRSFGDLMQEAVYHWSVAEPNDPDWKAFRLAAAWVLGPVHENGRRRV